MRTITTIKRITTTPNMSATNILVDFELEDVEDLKTFKKKLNEFQMYLDGQKTLKV